MTTRVHDPGEPATAPRSRLRGPIRQLTFFDRALLFAELAMIAYDDDEETPKTARRIGFPDVTLYDRDGSQVYRFRNDHDCVIACRGTEPSEWNDIRADANALSVLAETVGRVHRGFKREVDDLWPMLETALIGNEQPLWFCGHSLGGAMATIAAGRCYLSHIASIPRQVFTYGSPRVGNRRYVNYVELEHYRFVHNNDIVTRVPPVWMGYRHCGRKIYIDRRGRIRRMSEIAKRRDRWRGFVRGVLKWRIDPLADHLLGGYVAAIAAAAEAEATSAHAGGPRRPRGPRPATRSEAVSTSDRMDSSTKTQRA